MILGFMRQFQSNLASLRTLSLKWQPSTLGAYEVDVVNNTILLENKR